MDYLGIGFTYLLAGVGFYGGLLTAFIGICLDLYNQTQNQWLKVLYMVWTIGLIIIVGIFIYYLVASGSILIKYGKEQEQFSGTITLNVTCTNETNCTIKIPDKLPFNCLQQECPPQNVCPTQTPIIIYRTIPGYFSSLELPRF